MQFVASNEYLSLCCKAFQILEAELVFSHRVFVLGDFQQNWIIKS